jgi:tRNA U34 5-methylaminomethyl-2-thiouridine-forming methyltransferase MnmC
MSSTRLMTPAYLEPGYSSGVDELEPRMTADGSATLFSSRYAQTFHSHHGALSESRHVFLEGSGVAARLRAGRPARVLEVGFGTALNFLITAQSALDSGTVVRYVALERDLMPLILLEPLEYRPLAPLPYESYRAFRSTLGAEPEPGIYPARLPGAELELRIGEAQEATVEVEAFDAVYHDGFSPDANPELWTDDFLTALADSLVPGGVLVSYTVKGEVRRRLARAGLEVDKLQGPAGGKREMSRARKPA